MFHETLRVHLGLAHWLPLREIAEMKGLVLDGGSDLMTNVQHVLVLRGSLLVRYHHDKIGTRFIPYTDKTPSGVRKQTIDFACWGAVALH